MPHLHVQTGQIYGSVSACGWFLLFHAFKLDVSYPAKLNILTRVPYKSLCPPWKVLLSWRSNLKNQPFTTRTPPSYKVVCSRINGEFKHIPTINLTLILANLNQILLGKFFLPALPQSRPLFTSSCSLQRK